MQIGICDDEIGARQILAGKLERSLITQGQECTFFDFSSGEGLLRWLEQHTGELDVLFLDIEMGGIKGVDASDADLRGAEDAQAVAKSLAARLGCVVAITGAVDAISDGRQVVCVENGHPMQAVKPSLFNRSYTANMLTAGQLGGAAEIIAAVFPCAWTYADYGKRLKSEYVDRLSDNYYRSWIETYASDGFSASFEWMYDAHDDLCRDKNAEALQRIEEIFVSSVEFEYLFWDMAYKWEMSY